MQPSGGEGNARELPTDTQTGTQGYEERKMTKDEAMKRLVAIAQALQRDQDAELARLGHTIEGLLAELSRKS